MLKIGDKIPTQVAVFDEANKPITLSSLLSKPIVLYFYPKDNTPGCTIEAQNFRELNREFTKLGYQIIGVSSDSVASHEKFKNKHELSFKLLSDPEHKLQQAFGVWQEKRMFGKSFMGTVRSTFLINKAGKIEQVWARVQPKDHSKKVLDYLKTLKD